MESNIERVTPAHKGGAPLVEHFVGGEWVKGTGARTSLLHAVSGDAVAEIASGGLDMASILDYGRRVGGAHLRAMTFFQRARMLKELGKYLTSRKEEFYPVSSWTGATKVDSWIDIEGGFGTLFVFSSKGRKELPDDQVYVEGPLENISKEGTFVGRHICMPKEGIALHINAFNFPVWGMLEKLAPTWLAGMPALVKPASATCYLTERVVRAIVESGLVPEGALQLVCGSIGNAFDQLTEQDVVTFTGSAATGRKLKQHPKIIENSVPFNMEADSLNFSLLGSDVKPGSDDFTLFIKEVVREMTVKAGQKCTAIRRTLVPEAMVEEVSTALREALLKIAVGDPSIEGVRMGPLASKEQVEDVRKNAESIGSACEWLLGKEQQGEIKAANPSKGAFYFPTLLLCRSPGATALPHDVEAFGPVNTLMPYRNSEEAIDLVRRGRGSLVGSVVTSNEEFARTVVRGVAAYHGRIVVLNKSCAKESTGHGSPLPHLVHGGPGRAGGGEEMGGIRGVLHYMQRTALQGSPSMLSAISGEWMKGAERTPSSVHPFRKYFEELEIGDSLTSHRRTVTEADVVNFAGISGDFFYAHMDDIAAKSSIFERRVAHGYFVLSAAAGLFVDPAPGPVLANYGLDNLRFVKPVYIGDTIQATLTCKAKTAKDTPEGVIPQGVVAWDVEVKNQADELVATYTILTLVRRREEKQSLVH